jgi:hypothetical protein
MVHEPVVDGSSKGEAAAADDQFLDHAPVSAVNERAMNAIDTYVTGSPPEVLFWQLPHAGLTCRRRCDAAAGCWLCAATAALQSWA